MLIVTNFDVDKKELSILDTEDGVTEPIGVIQLIELVEEGIVSCVGFTTLNVVNTGNILCHIKVDNKIYSVDVDKNKKNVRILSNNTDSGQNDTDDDARDTLDENVECADTPVIVKTTEVKNPQNKNKVRKKEKEVKVKDTHPKKAIPDLLVRISDIGKKLQGEFGDAFKVEFTGDVNSKLVLRAANNEFTYFVGDELIIVLDSKLSSDFTTKNRVLELLSEIPFTNTYGESVNLLEVCCGTYQNIDVYAAFSPELTASESVSKIEVLCST